MTNKGSYYQASCKLLLNEPRGLNQIRVRFPLNVSFPVSDNDSLLNIKASHTKQTETELERALAHARRPATRGGVSVGITIN